MIQSFQLWKRRRIEGNRLDILFFLVCFFPYLSVFVVPGMDIQPLFIPTACGFLFFGVYWRHWKFDKYEFILLGVACFFLLYVNWGKVDDLGLVLRKNTALLFGWLVLVCARRLHRFPVWLFYFVPAVYLFASLVQLLYPSGFENVIEYLMSPVRTSAIRGVTGLCPEPSFLSIIGLCFLAVLLLERQQSLLLFFLVGLVVVISRSATGIGVLCLFLFVTSIVVPRWFFRFIVVLPLIVFVTFLAYQIPGSGEGQIPATGEGQITGMGEKGESFASKGRRYSILTKGVQSICYDPSCLYRLLSLTAGVNILAAYPLGTRLPFDPDTAVVVAEKTGLIDFFVNNAPTGYKHGRSRLIALASDFNDQDGALRLGFVEIVRKTGYINALASHFHRMGVLFVAVLFAIFSVPAYWKRKNLPVLFLIMFGWCFSTTLAYPPFWFLMGRMLPRLDEDEGEVV